MFSPPIPAMTTVSHSSGPMPESPSHSRRSSRFVTPQASAFSRARCRGPDRRSLAMAELTPPWSISHTGRYA